MNQPESIFLQFNLPNSTTWFYFSLLLAIALFFKFTRWLSVRNWDILSLFLPIPGLLLLLESTGENHWGHVWLLFVTGYFLTRCLLDLALVQRPALSPNLDSGGLAWLAGALFISLVAVAVRQPYESQEEEARHPPVTERVQRGGEQVLSQQAVPNASLWVARALAVACHLAIVIGLVCVCWWHFRDAHAGMAAATLYLLLPYTYLFLPQSNILEGEWSHVWPMALMVWAVAAYRKPAISGLLLGLATGSVYFPLLVFPVWLSFYMRRGAGRFAVAFFLGAGLCALWLMVLAWFDETGLLRWSADVTDTLRHWQPWLIPSAKTPGVWEGVHWAYRIPVFIAYISLVLVTAIWPSPKNLAQVLALSAALLIGTQFWYASSGGVHVLWYLPYLLLMVFRPNLSMCQPPAIVRETDWLTQLGRKVGRWFVRYLGRVEQTVKV